jgi:hypothetical protein
MFASAAMALSSLSVVGNSLRLKTQSLDWKLTGQQLIDHSPQHIFLHFESDFLW